MNTAALVRRVGGTGRPVDTVAFGRAPVRVARSQSRRLLETILAAIRRKHYVAESRVTRALPDRLRRFAELDDAAAVGSRRLEIGSGDRPEPGFIHVDSDRLAHHVEFFAVADRIPLPSQWAAEVRAVHVLEHVHPSRLTVTLAEWHRVLAPGGRVVVHVPDSAALMRAYLEAPIERRWSLVGALLGMYANPEVMRPEDLRHPADHQILFDSELLICMLEEAGFIDVQDVSADVRDVHSEGWASVLPQISIIVSATKTATGSPP